MPFQKGQSGNINGRPKGARSKSTVIKARKLDALRILENALTDGSISTESRIAAASTLVFLTQSAAQQGV